MMMRIIGQCLLCVAMTAVGLGAASAQAPKCNVKHQAFAEGGVAQGEMRLINNGVACGFTFKFGGKFEPNTWKVEQTPKHGQVDAGGSTVKYVPDNGYAGPDEFTVAVFGTNPMRPRHEARDGRFHFTVDVSATR